MTDQNRAALVLLSKLLQYPDERFFADLDEFARQAQLLLEYEDSAPLALTVLEFIAGLKREGQSACAENYVATFDHTSSASLYLAWHRYGNDRGQGKAMAALNGLYRTAGLEPLPGCMPDFLPRMLEFMAIAPDWGREAILDGFAPEMMRIVSALKDWQSPYAPVLEEGLKPLAAEYPELFRPREGKDRTVRPMAAPEPEPIRPV